MIRNSDAPKGEMRAWTAPPVEVVQTIAPVNITQPRPGVFLEHQAVEQEWSS